MKNKNKKNLIFISLLLFFLLGAGFVFALEINYPRIPGAIPPQDFIGAAPEDILSFYVKYFFNLALWLAGIIALGAFIYGGLGYLTSAGKPEAMVSAKNQITAAFFGLLILLSSYLILNILSPEFTILKIPPLEKIEPIEKRYVPPPSLAGVYSSIDVELPLGRIIERIFETYISDLPDSVVRKPRIERIKENASKTLTIAQDLKKQSEELRAKANKCKCSDAKPVCPGCRPLGAPSLESTLGADGLLQYNNITGNISNIIGAENLGQALELSTNISDSVGNIADFSNVLNSITNISRVIPVPENLTQVFGAAGNLAVISENPTQLFGSLEGLSSLITVPANLSQVFEFAKTGLNIVENPNNLGNLLGSVKEMSGIAGLNLNEAFLSVGPIGKVVENPKDLSTIFREVKNISDKTGLKLNELFLAARPVGEVVKTPQDLKVVFGAIEEISNRVSSPDLNKVFEIIGKASKTAQNPQELIDIVTPQITNIIPPIHLNIVLENIGNIAKATKTIPDLINIQKTVQDLSKIGLAPQQLTNVLGNLQNISGVIKIPADFGIIQIGIEKLSQIGLPPEQLTGILGNLGNISGIIKNPTDLGNIQTAVQGLSNIIPVPENLTSVLGNLQGISGIIQDPTNLGNIQSAVSQLAGVMPGLGNFTNVLGNLGEISGIIQDPTNLSNVMGSVGEFAQITPLGELPNVLGEIGSLGNLFQSPQNLVGAFIGVGGSCTCDPCRKVRGDIEKIEKDNLTQINSLKTEQKKTIDEIKDLKTELGKLERAESFIKYCPDIFKNSYAEFLDVKKVYEATGGIVREIPFWDDIIIPYTNKEGKIVPEWATFLCTIGGNILPTTRALFEEEQKMEEVVVKEKPKACSVEIPVGEIIDRTKKTTQLLIKRLEKLVELDKEMIDAVDDLQVLVSQCTSQAPNCRSICIPLPHGGCYKKCVEREGACPKSKIDKQFKKIQKIFERELDEEEEGIKNVIENQKPDEEEKKERIGIITLINPDDPDSVVSRILAELDEIQRLASGIRGIRYPLQTCGVGQSEETLLTCQKARGDIDPEGRIIRTCCLEELVFKEGLEKCYLEEGVEKYKVCFQNYLNKEAKEAKAKGVPRPEEIAQCRNSLNFFCCLK